MDYSFKDYINESTKYMYDDDDYITEVKVSVDGKKYTSKKAAEEDLKKKGLNRKQINDKMRRAKEIKSSKSEGSKDAEPEVPNFKKQNDAAFASHSSLRKGESIDDVHSKMTHFIDAHPKLKGTKIQKSDGKITLTSTGDSDNQLILRNLRNSAKEGNFKIDVEKHPFGGIAFTISK